MLLRRVLLYSTLLGLLFSTTALAAEVTQDKARLVAENWIQHLTKENRAADYVSGARQVAAEEVIFFHNTFVGYNFILHPSGHVVVPARDELPPVKLYSDTTTLRMTDDSPVVEWIKEELFKLNEALDAHQGELAGIDHGKTPNGRLWALFVAGPSSFPQAYEQASSGQESLSLGPLLGTTWTQDAPYNMYTPLWYDGQSTLTGCVATAAAQIMKYWNHPATGQGSTSYSWWNGSATQTLSRDFSLSTYNWGLMKSTHTPSDTAAEKDAVARLMSDVGIAFHMAYGPSSVGGSGANTLYGTTVFPTNFGYANTITAVFRTSYPSDSAWMQVFKNEVQNGRPSQLRVRDPNAGGHSVVVDGYRDYPSEQVHINLGWGGVYDGWYVTNNIVTGGYSWSDVNYQAAVIGIVPVPLPTVTTPTATPASPQVVGTPITFTATASGGVAPLQYKWFIGLNGAWSVGQNWGTGNTFSWTPGAAGTYSIQVWVRNNATTAEAPEATGTAAYTVTSNINLAPYQPAGWSAPIVVASVPTSFIDVGVYSASATYYIAFAVGNFGTGNVSGRFNVDLYDNNVYRGTGYCDNLPSGYYCAWSAGPYSFGTPGTHALKMVVDSAGAVAESNEADNVYIKTITVNP